jgi:hypothetical protein
MDMQGKKQGPGDAGWWARMPSGGVRRIWVARQDGNYACRVEIDDAPGGGQDPAVREHVTARREEALEFLGNDDLAHSALRAAETGN